MDNKTNERRRDYESVNPVMQPVLGAKREEQKPGKYDYFFGTSPGTQQAYESRNMAFQDMLNARKQAAVQQRTDDVKMARYNAMGNLLTSLVQPIGWGIGGGFSGSATGGVQPYDDRQYLEAFNRAVMANDDLRNIGLQEDEYRFKVADEEYRRQRALDDAKREYALRQQELEQKDQYKQEQQAQLYELKGQLEAQKIAGRIERDAQNAALKHQFKVGGRKMSGNDSKAFITKATNAYFAIVQDYEKKKAANIQGLQAPPSFDDFLKTYGQQEGVTVTEGGPAPADGRRGSGPARTSSTAKNSATSTAPQGWTTTPSRGWNGVERIGGPSGGVNLNLVG